MVNIVLFIVYHTHTHKGNSDFEQGKGQLYQDTRTREV